MTRALLLLLVAPAVASAQGFNLPYRTGSTFYQPSFGRYAGGFYGGFNSQFRLPNLVPYNGYGYLSPGGYYDPGFFTTVGPNVYYVPSYAGEAPRPLAPVVPALVGAGAPTPGVRYLPATPAPVAAELRLEFPASAEVWLNGVKQDGTAATRTFTSPALPAGTQHVFTVKAVWTAGGAQQVWERAVPVAAGSRSKLLVAAGDKPGS
jgi:uncharacterized protein (TIGR03000 family)